MTHDTWTIGELAAGTGVPVKTLRYYSDSGLLPVAGRPPRWPRVCRRGRETR
ncbi:MerR family DNA-binding transcriptional regulator [Streptomyces sp. NBC_01343]|nr:MerR family DNA-binding transcriptional regulator [Streptomyces sp. NBC_01343]